MHEYYRTLAKVIKRDVSNASAIRIVTLAAFLLCGALSAYTQNLRDSKGYDFWLAFPPNDRNTGGQNEFLTIFITSEFDTRATIAATRRDGQTDTFRLSIVANTVVPTQLSYSRYELVGASFPSRNGQNTGDCERPSSASVHIASDDEVTVYASSRELYTSDAWLVLPTDAIGNDYRVFSYLSDAQVDTTFFGVSFRDAFPGQFVIVATEDSTSVSMTIRGGRTSVSVGSQRSCVLNRGQSYLVQAAVTATDQNDDITGSRVRADKPIALISGHFRAQVPVLSDAASRDILVEQVPSVDTWGKHIIVVPLNLPFDYVEANSNDVPVLRILAHEDGTLISVNGGAPFPFVQGSRWDRPLTRPTVVDANKPILCGIIDRSAKRSGSTNLTGDPSLIIVPPNEQFLDHYQVISIEPGSPSNPVYTEQFITVTVPTAAASTMRIDGNAIVAPFTPIVGTTYSYAHISVASGSHALRCDSTFGIIVYGYGPAESYGYTGGMAFERLYQPHITLRIVDTIAAPGESISIRAVVDSIHEAAAFDALSARQLYTSVNFNRSMFVPNKLSIVDMDYHRANVSYEYVFDTLRTGDTVAFHFGTAVLGDAEVDTLDLVDVSWQDAAGKTVVVDTRIIRGTLTIDDLCRDGGIRLFDPHTPAQTTTRYFDLTGRELPSPQLGWNIRLTTIGSMVKTERIYFSN